MAKESAAQQQGSQETEEGHFAAQAAGAGGIEPVRTITTAVIPRGKLKNK